MNRGELVASGRPREAGVDTAPQPSPGRVPILRGADLTQVYDGRTVIAVDSIDVIAGEVTALLGPNGAGKSTLMRILAGLETPATGRLFYKGRALADQEREFRRETVAMLQRPYLWRGTVRDNVEYALRLRRMARKDRSRRVADVLASLGVSALADAPVRSLSGGEAQRVALARALAPTPELLFLDEPASDLDVGARRGLLLDLERLVREAEPALVLITHDPGEAFALADRVIVLERGKIVQAGSPVDVFESPATEFVASFTGAEFMLEGEVADAGAGTVIVRLESGHLLEAQGSAAAAQRVVVAYRPEDIVLATTRARSESSARNKFLARIVRIGGTGGFARLRLDADGLELEAVITRHSLSELGLEVGSTVVAQMKAAALHAFHVPSSS